MTPLFLLKDLCKELKLLFENSIEKTPEVDPWEMTVYKKMNVFEHSLPIRQQDQEDDPYPFIVASMSTGKGGAAGDTQEIVTRMMIGIYDDNESIKGHEGVLNVINKIYARFATNPILADCHIAKIDDEDKFNWALQEDDTHPYYFGAVEMKFITSGMRREDKF